MRKILRIGTSYISSSPPSSFFLFPVRQMKANPVQTIGAYSPYTQKSLEQLPDSRSDLERIRKTVASCQGQVADPAVEAALRQIDEKLKNLP
ncbi:MAG: hypothetical protein JWL80_194 [Parcubacteria group bacterium]|nr:hypothetical protein [Parcubacteria group bacterium]